MNHIWNEISPSSNIWARENPFLYDKRGYFWPIHSVDDAQVNFEIRQQNISFSNHNVLRGLHNEIHQAQIVTLVTGSIRDVIVDLRDIYSSLLPPKIYMVRLSSDHVNQIIIPEGCFHGYFVESSQAIIHYSSSTVYNTDNQRGIHWTSKEIVNLWGEVTPIVSTRDDNFPNLSDYISNLRLGYR
jgi:dTDP-4-dehydrorhamnose 3,5-epimerase